MIDYNQKLISGNYNLIGKRDMDAMHYWHFTFVSIAGVIRGSHVTTIDGARFCGADDNVGGFGNVLVTGRQTQANIFFALLLSININLSQRYNTIQKMPVWISVFNIIGWIFYGFSEISDMVVRCID